MRKIIRDIASSMGTSVLLNILNLLFSSIAFLNINNTVRTIFLFSLIFLGCMILLFTLKHNCKSLFQKASRFFLVTLFYFCFLLLGAYSGITRSWYGLFYLAEFASNNNVSGLLSLLFSSAMAITGLLIVFISILRNIFIALQRKKIEEKR